MPQEVTSTLILVDARHIHRIISFKWQSVGGKGNFNRINYFIFQLIPMQLCYSAQPLKLLREEVPSHPPPNCLPLVVIDLYSLYDHKLNCYMSESAS